MKRLGEGALPFSVQVNPQAPPSVQLVPAKRYYGAPIGTSYDVRCYIGQYPRVFPPLYWLSASPSIELISQIPPINHQPIDRTRSCIDAPWYAWVCV